MIHCPHCGRELNVPEDSENIVCMFCAQPIDVQEILNTDQNSDSSEYDLQEIESLLSRELFTTRLDAGNFNASNYSEQFQKYLELFRPALECFQRGAKNHTDAAAEQFAGLLFQKFMDELPGKKGKKPTDVFDCRFTITSLTIPSILSMDSEPTEKAADCFLKKWNGKFPKETLGKATYEQIQSGFKRKLCYITTAVCGSLGAGDDCTELNEFRMFRDSWLAKAPGGREKIAEYYLFAPLIVQAIDQSGQATGEYRRIWKEYLTPCLSEIRSGQQDECARDYEKMVRSLEQKWLA